MEHTEAIIQRYIAAYNRFDIQGMVAHLDENIEFQNISNGETTLSLKGIAAFKAQAEQASSFFSSRRQTIKSFRHQGYQTEVEIDYTALLAIDLPNGLQKGDTLELQGKSIFTFANGKIVRLTDIS